MAKKPTQDERVAPILAEPIEEHPEYLNREYAEEVNRRLGLDITNKDISRIRNKIGLGWYEVIHAQALKQLQKALKK